MPAALFLVIFFALPLGDIASRSVDPSVSANYSPLTESELYGRVFLNTFKVAGIVTVLCLVLGYPFAYLMRHTRPVVATILLAVVLLPFWTSFLVRTYAWIILLQDTGVINDTAKGTGLIDSPLPLIRNLFGISVGMTHVLLPFMVLPLYATMRRIDPIYMAAAESLGATRWQAFRRVYLPLTMPGIAAGALLVFVLSIGFYVTPTLLGGPQDTMIGELIVSKFSEQLDFGGGSALGLTLLAATLILLFIGSRFVRLQDVFGVSRDD